MYFCLDLNPWLVVLFVCMVATYLYRYMKQTYSVLEKLGITGPKPVWIFGNVLEFKGKNVLSVFDEWKKEYGGVYGFYEGFRAGVVINDVDFAKDILNRHFDNFHTRTSYRPFVYGPDSQRLVEIKGEHWKHQRAVVNKMLRCTGNTKQVSEKMLKAVKTMSFSIEQDRQISPEEINLRQYINNYVLEGVVRVVLNMDDADMKQYKDDIHNYIQLSEWSAAADNEAAGLARLFPTLTPLMKLADKDHKKACEKVMNILKKYIEETLDNQNNNTIKKDDHASLLSYLVSTNVLSREIDGSLTRRDLSTDEIITHVISLLSEMYSTTDAAIQFILYELALNPDIQSKLYDEICRCCGTGENFTLSDSQNMDYFEMILYETLRVHPIAPGISRVCTQSCKIRNVTFKEGMVVRIMSSTLYKDEKHYPEPEVFDPERFSKKNRETRHQYSFLPFGQGPRMCPGQKLAMIEVKYAVINIIKSYVISTSKNTEIPLKEVLRPSLTPANGVTVTLTPRS